jgi:hypothetical protein
MQHDSVCRITTSYRFLSLPLLLASISNFEQLTAESAYLAIVTVEYRAVWRVELWIRNSSTWIWRSTYVTERHGKTAKWFFLMLGILLDLLTGACDYWVREKSPHSFRWSQYDVWSVCSIISEITFPYHTFLSCFSYFIHVWKELQWFNR